LKEFVPSYDLLLELLSEHKSYSHSSSLSELLPCIITLTNINSIIRTKQTKHIKDKAEAPTMAKASKKALKATVTLETVTVFREAKVITNITYLYVKRNVIFITS
jgi:hypothetical protein